GALFQVKRSSSKLPDKCRTNSSFLSCCASRAASTGLETKSTRVPKDSHAGRVGSCGDGEESSAGSVNSWRGEAIVFGSGDGWMGGSGAGRGMADGPEVSGAGLSLTLPIARPPTQAPAVRPTKASTEHTAAARTTGQSMSGGRETRSFSVGSGEGS